MGQTGLSDAVIEIFRVLYTKLNKPSGDERADRHVKSISDDMLFVTTRPRTKPGKHF